MNGNPRFAVFIVVAGGMLFAKIGQNTGLPWWIYDTVPMVVTVGVPLAVFRMNVRETLAYLVFSFFLGWKDYMPFIAVPAFWEL